MKIFPIIAALRKRPVAKGADIVTCAGKIHTDLATHFHHAVDAKRHVPMGKDHKLQAGDVVKIVATK